MIIIIPIGGIGQRFKDNGYKKPKALINLYGKFMLSYLLDNLNIVLTALNGEPLVPAAAAAAFLVKESLSAIKSQIPNLTSKSVKTA